MVAAAVGPDVPGEERPDGARIVTQEMLEVEEPPVVERCHDAHLLEGGGVALVVFDGVGVGVEDVGAHADGARGVRGSLHEVVVVGIHAGNHVGAEAVGEGNLLALRE